VPACWPSSFDQQPIDYDGHRLIRSAFGALEKVLLASAIASCSSSPSQPEIGARRPVLTLLLESGIPGPAVHLDRDDMVTGLSPDFSQPIGTGASLAVEGGLGQLGR
jgi:hypothetical protein